MAAATTLLGAFLLFLVQPLIARFLLPWFGGATAVWTTAMLFFQSALLAGYAYAHWVVRRPPRQAVALHTALVGLSLLWLPIVPEAAWKPTGEASPVVALLVLLLATVGLPFILLSATGPLVQAWVARAEGRSPYRLYALSNAGSLGALFAYPLLVEPSSPIGVQAWAWSGGYGVFAILVVVTAWRLGVAGEGLPASKLRGVPAGWVDRALWVGLAAAASTLLLAVTAELSHNVAPVPLLWVLPLAIYLLTFILCFESDRWYRRGVFLRLLPLAIGGIAWVKSAEYGVGIGWEVAAFGAGLFFCCMVCHGELAAIRPAPERLTGFYLAVSIGGALGGVFVGVVAPLIFTTRRELVYGLVATAVGALVAAARDPALGLARLGPRLGPALVGLVALLPLGAIAISGPPPEGLVLAERNFYGTFRVVEGSDPAGGRRRELYHGETSHGLELLAPGRSGVPTTYYGRASGVGLAARLHEPERPRRIGLIGLGVGTLASYADAGDVVRIYELDPRVVSVARSHFGFLSRTEARMETVFGDARASLERESPQAFDLFAADAFSGSAVPVHLLSVEAFAEMKRHLAPGGVLAVHVSHPYLDLASVAAAALREVGLQPRVIESPANWRDATFVATWVLASQSRSLWELPEMQAALARTGVVLRDRPAWTDERVDLIGALRWEDS